MNKFSKNSRTARKNKERELSFSNSKPTKPETEMACSIPNRIISLLNKIKVTIEIKTAQIAVTPYLLKNDFQLIDDPCVIDRLRPAINKKLNAIIRSKSRQSGWYIKSDFAKPKYIKSKAK